MGGSIFGNYEGYETWPFQIIGIFVVLLVSILFALGFVKPQVYDLLASSDEKNLSIIQSNSILSNIADDSYIEMSEK